MDVFWLSTALIIVSPLWNKIQERLNGSVILNLKIKIMEVIAGIIFLLVLVFLTRAFGAWMLRIDEVIDTQKKILEELRKR
jgi:hypothetical protein